MIKVVLWDIDNTLLDFIAAERAAIRKCFSIFDMGECTDEMLAAYSAVNVRWWERLERGERTKPEILLGRFREFFSMYGRDPALAEASSTRSTRSAWETPWCFSPGQRRPWRL